jgi:hypothetical protein
MALTALEEQRLEAVGLVKYFDKNRARYKKMAAKAYAYTATTLEASKQIVRQDDVSGHLEAEIELDQTLKDYLAQKKKPQQYWYRYFTFLILDRLWKELQDDHKSS